MVPSRECGHIVPSRQLAIQVVADVRAQNLQLARGVNDQLKLPIEPVANTIFKKRGTCFAQTVALTKCLIFINFTDSLLFDARVSVENRLKHVNDLCADEKHTDSATGVGVVA